MSDLEHRYTLNATNPMPAPTSITSALQSSVADLIVLFSIGVALWSFRRSITVRSAATSEDINNAAAAKRRTCGGGGGKTQRAAAIVAVTAARSSPPPLTCSPSPSPCLVLTDSAVVGIRTEQSDAVSPVQGLLCFASFALSCLSLMEYLYSVVLCHTH